MNVFSGSEETKRCVHTCGSWALHPRDLHHSSDLSLPHGLALGMGLHPWVNTTLLHLSTLRQSSFEGTCFHKPVGNQTYLPFQFQRCFVHNTSKTNAKAKSSISVTCSKPRLSSSLCYRSSLLL